MHTFGRNAQKLGARGSIDRRAFFGYDLYMRTFMHILCLLLGGCSTVYPYYGTNKWEQEPELLIDSSMSHECLKATEKAVELYAEHGIFLVPKYLDGTIVKLRTFSARTITIIKGNLPEPVIGETSVEEKEQFHQIDGKKFKFIFSASIVLEECPVSVVAHELGHALGLDDFYDEEHSKNLMYFVDYGNSELEDSQIEWIRWD